MVALHQHPGVTIIHTGHPIFEQCLEQTIPNSKMIMQRCDMPMTDSPLSFTTR